MAKRTKYNIDYWDLMIRLNTQHAQEICDIRWNFVKEINPKTVLDFGCGMGHFRAFRPEGTEVDTYDIGGWPQTGIHRSQYDLITFWDVIEHIKKLEVLRPVLKMASHVAVTVPIKPEGGKLVGWKHYKPGEHFHYFSVKSLKAWFDSEGFEFIAGGWPEEECGIREDIFSGLFRAKKRKVVFTNGVFDLLHEGHLWLIDECNKLGDIVIVGIDSNKSANALGKKPVRPVNDESIRKRLLERMTGVNQVIIFDDLPEMIKELKPDVLVKGGDYTLDQVVCHEIVQSYGGKVVVIPYLEGKSTTNVIRKIMELGS